MTTQVVLAFARDSDARVVACFSLFTCLSRSENVGNQYIDFVSNKIRRKSFISMRTMRSRISWKSRKRVSSSTYSNTTTVTHNSCVLGKNEKGNRSIVKAAALKRQFKNPRCLYSTRCTEGEKSSIHFISYQKRKICQIQIFLLLP